MLRAQWSIYTNSCNCRQRPKERKELKRSSQKVRGRGWCNYHRHACSSRTFQVFDHWFFWAIKRWLHRRHPNKGRHWLRKKYYRTHRGNQWSFYASQKRSNGTIVYKDLFKAGWIRIIRHVKIRAEANPYEPAWKGYFINRRAMLCRLRRTDPGSLNEEYGWSNDMDRLQRA